MAVSKPDRFSGSASSMDGGHKTPAGILFAGADSADNPVGSVFYRSVGGHLAENGWRVEVCPSGRENDSTQAEGPFRLAGLPLPPRILTLSRWLAGAIPRYEILHVLFTSGISFSRQVAPALLLGRFLGKRVVLSYLRNQAEVELERSGWWMIAFLRLCHRIVVSSENIVDLFAHYGLMTDLIPNTGNSHLLTPRKVEAVQPKIIVARSLENRNNVTSAIEAFGLVKQKYPRAEMVIAGDGSQRKELQSLTAKEKLNGVTFTGWVSTDELSRLYAEADLYLNASSIDGLPTSLLEALTVGLPIVTTAAGGIGGVIKDGRNGLIAERNAPPALAERIIELIESPKLVQEVSRQAKLSAADYSLPVVGGKWSELYFRLGTPAVPTSVRASL